ncbi:unnamed protein product, partial [Sphacelaria rigidula]
MNHATPGVDHASSSAVSAQQPSLTPTNSAPAPADVADALAGGKRKRAGRPPGRTPAASRAPNYRWAGERTERGATEVVAESPAGTARAPSASAVAMAAVAGGSRKEVDCSE